MNFTTSGNTAPLCPAPFGDKITILNAHQQKSPLDAPKGARLHSMPGFVDFYCLSSHFEMRSRSAFCWILRQTEWCDTDNGAVLALVACFFFEFSLETSLRENGL